MCSWRIFGNAQSALVFHMIDCKELPPLINFSAEKSKRSPNEVFTEQGNGRTLDVFIPVTCTIALH